MDVGAHRRIVEMSLGAREREQKTNSGEGAKEKKYL